MNFDFLQPHSRGAVKVDGLTPSNKGLLLFADGVNWNPGAGAGYYLWNGSALVHVGDGGAAATAVNADKLDNLHASELPGALVWEKTVTGSAVSSVTTNGEVTIDLNLHGAYEFSVTTKNVSGVASYLRIFINGDLTATNYNIRGNWAGSNSGNINANDCYLDTGSSFNNDSIVVWGLILLPLSGYPVIIYSSYRFTPGGVGYTSHASIQKLATVTNVTRLDWAQSVANGIAVDSVFRLWRLK